MERVRAWTIAAVVAGCGLAASATQAPLQSSPERDFLTRIRRLTVEGRRAGEGYWSPDGKRLVFQSEREPGNPFYQIYVLDLASGDVKRVSPGMGKTTCAFFRPGSDEMLFASRLWVWVNRVGGRMLCVRFCVVDHNCRAIDSATDPIARAHT